MLPWHTKNTRTESALDCQHSNEKKSRRGRRRSHVVSWRMAGRYQKKMAIRLCFEAGMHYSEVRVTNQLRGLWQGSEWTETVKGVKACRRVGEAMGKRNSRQVSIQKPKVSTICLKHFLVFSCCTIHFSFFILPWCRKLYSGLISSTAYTHWLPGTEVCI